MIWNELTWLNIELNCLECGVGERLEREDSTDQVNGSMQQKDSIDDDHDDELWNFKTEILLNGSRSTFPFDELLLLQLLSEAKSFTVV